MTSVVQQVITNDYALYHVDCVEGTAALPDNSIDLCLHSPPFPTMYTYSNSPFDMGNVTDLAQMIEQYRFLMNRDHLLRVMKPGRSCLIHLTQLTARKNVDGYIGIKDYRGAVINMMESEGWVYYGDITVDKDPQIKAIRTKDHGLMFKTLATDSSKMHVALADYLLHFKKPGDNANPIRAGISSRYDNPNGWITNEEWIQWAHPIWYDISETDVLNVRQARETDDERHLCPLQLPLIERVVKLWSAPGEVVYDPFAGIGSTGYIALQLRRKFIGCELKESYWRSAVENLNQALGERDQLTLFDLLEMEYA